MSDSDSHLDLQAILSAALEAYSIEQAYGAPTTTLPLPPLPIGRNNEVCINSQAGTGRKNQYQITVIPSAADLEHFDIDKFAVKYVHPAMRLLYEKIPQGRWEYIALETPHVAHRIQSVTGQVNLLLAGAVTMRAVVYEAPVEDESKVPPDATYTNPRYYDIQDDSVGERRVARNLRFDVKIVPVNFEFEP